MLESLIKTENIIINLDVSTKEEAVQNLVELLFENGYIVDVEKFKKDIAKREKLSTTAIGYGVAIPHAKSYYVKESVLGIAILKYGIDYKALDGQYVKIVFIVGTPEDMDNSHIDILSEISKKLIHQDFRELLLNADAPIDVYNLMKE